MDKSYEDPLYDSDDVAAARASPSRRSSQESAVTPAGIRAPEVKDGYFGYNEEKALHHIEEKLWAQRRGSDAATASRPVSALGSPHMRADADGPPYVGSFKLTAITEPAGQSSQPAEEQPTMAQMPDSTMLSEFMPIFVSLRKCLELRDKYILRSGQNLGFNPKDHDGVFKGLEDDVATVSGVRPDAEHYSPPDSLFKPWRIYPAPPPPHWHWKGTNTLVPSQSGLKNEEDEEFEFENCEIPGPHEWDFELDEKGVYQVYNQTEAEGG